MLLLKDGMLVPDPWRHVAADKAQPAAGEAVILPLAMWITEERERLLRTGNSRYGVALEPGDDVAELVPDLDRLLVIALTFPVFSDGRGFSQARVLRERYGYRGELRARGHLIRDQYMFLARCGITALEVPETRDPQQIAADWRTALAEFSVFYQPLDDGRQPAWTRRRAG